MLSQNRVQAIKSRFENLNEETRNGVRKPLIRTTRPKSLARNAERRIPKSDVVEKSSGSDDDLPKPNSSYLYSRVESNRALARQASDPGKKLHRSHAFRCERREKISPKRHSSCNGKSDMSEAPTLKIGEKPRLSRDRLKRLGLMIEDRMRKENYVPLATEECEPVNVFRITPKDELSTEKIELSPSVPDEEVPQHILDQYAKVLKPKKKTDLLTDIVKHDVTTDSGVSSETENSQESETIEKTGRLKALRAHFEGANKTEQRAQPDNVENKENEKANSEIYASTETIRRIERKNPHIILTDTLKKALKQPLPRGPPPKKPPRTFINGESNPNSPELSPKPERKCLENESKKSTKHMLDKLERALQKHNEYKVIVPRQSGNIYDIAESEPCPNKEIKKRKEIHYLCTEILDIAQRPLLADSNSGNPITNCFNSLNCAIPNRSSSSIGYTKFPESTSSRSSLSNICCACNNDSVENLNNITETRSKFSTFFSNKSDDLCIKCGINMDKGESFRCHLGCKCNSNDIKGSNDKVTKVCNDITTEEHIYAEPYHYRGDVKEGSGKKSISDEVTEGDGPCLVREVNNLDVSEKVPQNRAYGVLNLRRSLESLHNFETEDQKIYDIPCDPSRSPSPEARTFESLRRSFESRCHDQLKYSLSSDLPDLLRHDLATPKIGPRARLPSSRSTENLKDFGVVRTSLEKKFATDGARKRRFERNAAQNHGGGLTLQRKCQDRKNQLDFDRENLNKLMNEIYDTVTAQCDMETVSKFPVDTDCSGSEDSVKLSRSLTEKRKNYVRRVSSRVAYLEPAARNIRQRHQTLACTYKPENPTYSTFRSWKSFKKHRNNSIKSLNGELNNDDSSDQVDSPGRDEVDLQDRLDDTAGCLDIGRPVESREKGLFDVCLLVGLNHMTGLAYVKSVFPKDVTVPPHIENLVFPETISSERVDRRRPEYDLDSARTQCYSLVLTNERGERSFGYCRRVLPEGTTFCLPLAYCVISRFRAPGFYYKVLQELESHHGTSDHIFESFLQQLFEKDFPEPGESIATTRCRTPKKSQKDLREHRNSLNLGDAKSKTLQPSRCEETERCRKKSSPVPQFYDLENNNTMSSEALMNREVSSMTAEVKVIKRPIEPRSDEDNLSVLFDSINVGLLIRIFGTLLLERKVVIVSDKLSQLSSCIEALQAIMYPLVWQQPLVSTIPAELRRDILEAPLPILAGMLLAEWDGDMKDLNVEEGILVDLTKPGAEIILEQGDESSIIPSVCYKTLKTSLQLESNKTLAAADSGGKARNVLIAEAFLRFFVDIFSDFWSFFKYGKRRREEWEEGPASEEDVVLFEKDQFIKGAPNKQIQYFLEWFTETAMFNHFIQNMSKCFPTHREMEPLDFANIAGLVDTPYPNYYEVFDERTRRHLLSGSGRKQQRCVKTALNKKVKLLKSKLREFVN